MKKAWVLSYPLSAQRRLSDQTGRMPRLTWVFAERTLILLVLSSRVSFEGMSLWEIHWWGRVTLSRTVPLSLALLSWVGCNLNFQLKWLFITLGQQLFLLTMTKSCRANSKVKLVFVCFLRVFFSFFLSSFFLSVSLFLFRFSFVNIQTESEYHILNVKTLVWLSTKRECRNAINML